MIAVLFLLAVLWTLISLCAALAVLVDTGLIRARDLRHGGFILLVAFLGIAMRGQPWQNIAWLPMLAACWMTYRFLQTATGRARAQRHTDLNWADARHILGV